MKEGLFMKESNVMKKLLSFAIVLMLFAATNFVPLQTYANETDTVHIEAENYESSTSESVEIISNDLRKAVFAKEPDSFEYLEFFDGGTYLIKLNAATISDSLISISQDEEEIAVLTLNPSGAYENNYVEVNLKNGINLIEVSVKKGEVCIDYIDFSPVIKNESFVSSVNNAKTVEEVKKIFEDNEASLGVDVEELEKKIFYPDVIYASLIGRNFDTYEEIMDVLAKSISVETDYPKVSLKQGSKKLTALKSGDLKVTLKDIGFLENEEIFAFIYKDGEEAYRETAEINDETAEIYFHDVELLNGSEYSFEVFVEETPYKDMLTGVYRNIYVSESGKDVNDGSKNAPFKTLERAKEEIEAICYDMTGDIVINVEPGFYQLSDTLAFDNLSTAKNGYKVIIKGTDKENPPIISGGKKVEGFTDDDGDGIYRAKFEYSGNVRRMYVNGYPAMRAITETTYKVKSVYKDGDFTYQIDGITVDKSSFPYDKIKYLSELEFVWPLYWAESRTKAESIIEDENTITFVMMQPTFSKMDQGNNKWGVRANTPFYLENAVEFLDEEGEFYYDKTEGFIYYYPFEEENMDKAEVYIGDVEQLVTAKGNSANEKIENLIFENLEFRYGAMNFVSNSGIVNLQAEIYREDEENGNVHIPFQLEFENAKGIEIRNCRFACLGSGAISMTESVCDSTVEQNTFRDLSGGGVMIGTSEHVDADESEICKNILIKNNVFRRTGDEYRTSLPISTYYEKNIKIISNDIKDVPYSGISVGWGWGNLGPVDWGRMKISHNKIDNVMLTLNDGAQIYTLGPLKKSSIDFNYLLNSEYIISGIYTDSGSAYIDIHNNVVDDDNSSYWWYQGHNLTHDLTAYDNYSREGTEYRESGDGTNVIENHNYVTKGSSWPNIAQYTIDESGIEKKYEYLLDDMELPEWRENILERLPKGL